MTARVLQIGAGGFAEQWCCRFLPGNMADGTVEVVGLVDVRPDALSRAGPWLSLREDQLFTDARAAFEAVRPDFCTIVVPPAHHEAMVDLAIEFGAHILSEKPIADTMAGSVRIVEKQRASGLKMAVTMSHRFDQDKQTLFELVSRGGIGTLNALHCRLSSDMRRFDSWRRFRHEMAYPLLIEGAVHHIDILGWLAGSPCKSVYATSWRPHWAEYAGDTDACVVLVFENGVRATFEGSCASPVGVSDWQFEEIRADGCDGIALLNHRNVELFTRRDVTRRQTARSGTGMQVPPIPGDKWMNSLLIQRFVAWIEGGDAMETEAGANLESTALVFAAIESAETGTVVDVADFRKRHGLDRLDPGCSIVSVNNRAVA